jgi:hypothetical protein
MLVLQVIGTAKVPKASMVAEIFHAFRDLLAYDPAHARAVTEEALLQEVQIKFKAFLADPRFAGEKKAMEYCEDEWGKHLGKITVL